MEKEKRKRVNDRTINFIIIVPRPLSMVQFYQKKEIIDKPIKIWYRPTITSFRIANIFNQRSFQQDITHFLSFRLVYRVESVINACVTCKRDSMFHRIASRCAKARRRRTSVSLIFTLNLLFSCRFRAPVRPVYVRNSVDNRPRTRFEIFQLCLYACIHIPFRIF